MRKWRCRAGPDGCRPPERPDTGLLYSVDDVAALARVSKVLVVRLCLTGGMPEWREIEGRRYWTRLAAGKAVAQAIRADRARRAAKRIA